MNEPKEDKNILIFSIIAIVAIVGIVGIFGFMKPAEYPNHSAGLYTDSDLVGGATNALACNDPTGRTPIIKSVTPSTANIGQLIQISGAYLTSTVQFYNPAGAKWTYTGSVNSNCGLTTLTVPKDLPVGVYKLAIYKAKNKISNTLPISINPLKCTDSDGGLNYYVKGTTTDSNGQSGTDFCWNYDPLKYGPCQGNTNGCVLAEHYCKDDGTLGKTKYNCPYGCLNGACGATIAPVCGDSDGGLNYNVQGTVQWLNYSQTDRCLGFSNMTEWYCNGNVGDFVIADCDPKSCVNGACV